MLVVNGQQVVLDCGLFQGKRSDADQKNRRLLFDPEKIDAIVASHAHIDHIGRLPVLTRAGTTRRSGQRLQRGISPR